MDNIQGNSIANGARPEPEGSASVGFGRVIPTYAGLAPQTVATNPAAQAANKIIPTPTQPSPQPYAPQTPPQQPQKPPVHIDWRKASKIAAFALLGLLVVSAIAYTIFTIANRQSEGKVAGRFTTVEIPLAELIGDGDAALIGTRSLAINGTLQANGPVIFSPSKQPSNASRGQIYYDQDSNQLAYFNGAQFVQVGANQQTTVQSLGGQTGVIALGDGLATAGGAISNSGVLSLQGQTGNITLTAGAGMAIDGTTLTNAGVTSLGGVVGEIAIGTGLDVENGAVVNTGIISAASGSANISVTNDGNGNITISSMGGGTGTVQSPGGTAGRIAKFTGVQTVEDSLLSESGSTVTVNGNLNVTGSVSLANALTVGNGGTGATSLATNGVVIGQGSGALSAVTSAGAGLCFMSTAGAPQFAACPSGSGVASVNGQTGTLTIANATGASGTITIQDASTSQKGIAQFNGTNFSASAGIVNTIQNINTTADPTFRNLTLSTLNVTSNQATSPMALINNLNTGATGNLLDLQLNGVSRLAVTPAGNMTLTGTLNGQTISSSANFTGSLAVAGAANLNGGASVTGTLTANTITPSAAMTVGAGTQQLTLQGNGATTLSAVNGANATSLAFQSPTANVTYRLLTAAAGTYDICTSAGNCAGIGGGVTTSGGTTNRLPKFTGAQTIGDSIITDNGSTVTIGGVLSVNTITPSSSLVVGAVGQNVTLQGAATQITATSSGITNTLTFATPSGSNKTITVPNANGTVAVSASGPIAIDANGNITCTTCITSGGGGGGIGAVDSVNGLTGALTIANSTGSGTTITINDATTSQKGIASFNSTNFSVTSGAVNTVQNIHVAATPTFGALTLTSSQASSAMLLVNNTNTSATGNLIDLQLNGSSHMAVTPAGNMTLVGTVNGQTISSAASLTGTLAVAGAASLNGGATVGGTLTANTITPTSSMTIGATSQSVLLQGNASSTITATNGASTTTLSFQSPTANVNYRFPTAAAGTYDICTTAGNCTGVGGSITGSGTNNTLAKFTGTGSIGNSIITDDGTTVGIGGTLAVNTITPTGAMTVGSTAQNLTLQGAATAITATSGATTNTLTFATPSGGAKTITIPNASGTVAVSASGPIAIDANGNITCTTCVTSTGVTSLNGLTGALTLANATGSGATVTINDASTSQKGIAQFNSTNFSASSGTINTAQDINTTAAPTFGRLSITSSQATNPMVLVNNTNAAGTGNLIDLQLNGTSRFSVTPAGNVTAAGTINGQTISSSANFTGSLAVATTVTAGGNLTVSGGTGTFGTASQAGAAILYDGSSNTATIQTAALGQNTTYLLPDPGTSTATFCLTTGNCAGLGGGITGSGTTGRIAKFTASGSIGDSILTETSGLISVAGSINISTGSTYQINGTQISSGALSNDADLAKLGSTQTFTADNSFNGNVTLGDSAADTLAIGAVLQGATPLTFEGGTADANELALSIGTLTTDRTVTLGDESGTVCLQSSTNCGFAATTGGSGYIQNQSAAAQLANFYIQSAATATAPTAALRLASSQTGNLMEFQDTSGNIASRVDSLGFMHIDRAAATSDIVFTVKSTADTQSRLTISADGRIGWGSGSASLDNFLTRTAAGALEASNQFTVMGGLQVGAAGFIGKFTIQGGNTTTVSQVIRAVASQTADQIQLQDSLGNINASFNNTGNQLTLGRIAASGTVTQGKVVMADGTTSNFGLTIQTTTLSANRTITMPNETGTVCLQGSTTCGFAPGSGSANYIQNTTTQQTANMNIISAAAGSVGARIEGAANMSAQALLVRGGSNPSANVFEVQHSTGGQLFGVDSANSRVVVGNGSGCSGRLCVGQSTTGTGGGTATNLYNLNNVSVSTASTIIGHNLLINDTSSSVANVLRGFVIDATGTTNTSASINAIQVKLPASASGTALQIQNGSTDIVNVANSGATTFQNTTNSASAFRILNQGSGNLFNVDSTNGGSASLLGLNSAEVSTWATTSQSLPAARYGGATVTANGYVYYIGGNNTSNVAQTTVYSAKLNSDGTVGTWSTLTSTPLPSARMRATATVVNGYVYVLGGLDASSTATQTVYSAKLFADGTIGNWSTTNQMPTVRRGGSTITANGYIYYVGGQDNAGTPNTNVYYAKANPDGTISGWTMSPTVIPQARYNTAATTANGYMYILGGTNSSNVQQTTVYYAKLNGDGTIGSWTTASNPLPAARAESSAVVMNGYVYMLGGADTLSYVSTALYARLNADGSIGTWSTAANGMAANRASAGGFVSNGYMYMVGGYNGSTGVATVTHTTTARVQIGASLDLVGLQGQGIADPGDASGGSTGGSITAGNGTFVGALNVQGLASFNQGANVNGAFNVLGNANIGGDLSLTSKLSDSQGFESVTFVPTSPGTWTTGGNTNWSRVTNEFTEGTAAAGSGNIGHNQQSWIDVDYTFSQPGMLQFSWAVSSESTYDWLYVCVDDDECTQATSHDAITGAVDWIDVSIPVTAGTHSFRWVYEKDESTVAGSDKGWIDNVRFTGGTGKIKGNFLTLNGTYGINFDAGAYNVSVGQEDTIGSLFILDTKLGDNSDPQGINGAMYYNDEYGKFRCFENYSWKECINTPYLHRYVATSAQSITSATDTKINFASTVTDDGDISVASNNTFTINKPGIWAINASIRFGTGTGGTGERYLSIAGCVPSGQPTPRYGQTTNHQGGSYSTSLSTTGTARLTAGTEICIYGYQNSSGSLNTDTSWNGVTVSFTWLGY